MSLLNNSALCFTLLAGAAWGASPWVPEAGKLGITTIYVFDSFQDYHPGALTGRLPVPYKQYTGYTLFEYGLGKGLAIDVDTGYTSTDFFPNAKVGGGLGGIVDTTVGMRYQFASGENWVLTVRGAAIIKGSYDLTQLSNFSPGDKASGGLGSISVGNNWKYRMFSFAETGYRIRSSPVPQDFFGNVGVGQYWKGLTYSTSYQTSRSINGVDIVGAAPKFSSYFQPYQFPATKKIFGAMDYTANYRFRNGMNVGFDYSQILHGRNVGMKKVYAFSFGFVVPGHGPHLH